MVDYYVPGLSNAEQQGLPTAQPTYAEPAVDYLNGWNPSMVSTAPLNVLSDPGAAYDPNMVYRFDTGGGQVGTPDASGKTSYSNYNAPVVFQPGQKYTLADTHNNALGTATTPEEMQALIALADEKKNSGWNLYQGDIQPGAQLFGRSPRDRALLYAALAAAAAMGGGALLGAGSGAGGAGTAGTALGGTGAAGTAGTAGTAGAVAGGGLGTVGALAPTLSEIVVTGAPAGLGLGGTGALLGGTAAAAAALTPSVVTNPITGEMSVSNPQQPPVEQPMGGVDLADPNSIVVTGGRAPALPANLTNSFISGVPALTALTGPAAPATTANPKSTLDKVTDIAGAVGTALPFVEKLFGGGGNSGALATMPFGSGGSNPLYSAKLPTPGANGAFQVGGMGGNAPQTITAPGGDFTKFGMGTALDNVAPSDIPQYGGVSPAGYNPQTLEWLGSQPMSFEVKPPVKKAMGGYAVGGPGDGRSDEIPAVLSDGEYVMDAETVALLGNGSSKAGAKQLDKFRANIRKHKGRNLAQGKFSVKAKQPDAYLSGGRS